MPQQHLIVHIASSRVKSFFNLETSRSARMLAGSTQQLLLPRKDSHLQKDILLLLSVSHFLLCAKESAESLSVKTKHIDSKTRCTLGNAIPHSQLQNRGKPSLHSICGRYGRWSPVYHRVRRGRRDVSLLLNTSHLPTHPCSQTSIQTRAETHNATCCGASFALSFRTCQEWCSPILPVSITWDCPSLTLPLLQFWPLLSSSALLSPSAAIIVSLHLP